MRNKLSFFGILLVLASLGISRADENLNFNDFFWVPSFYKALSGWWCQPDPVYSECMAFIFVGHPDMGQGPQGAGVCNLGSLTPDIHGVLPSTLAHPEYWHGAAAKCQPGSGSFCETLALASTGATGGGGGAAGGCYTFQSPIHITKKWRAWREHGKWSCHGDCDAFEEIR